MSCDAPRPADSAGWIAVLLSIVFAATVHGDNIVWSQGLRLQRQVQGSAPDVMRIPLAAHQFVRIQVIQNGSDLAVRLYDPHGQPVTDVDSLNGRYGPETVVLIAEWVGAYRLEGKLGDPRDRPDGY